MKDCSTTSSLEWKVMMSLGWNEPIYTYNHQYTQYFIKKASYGGRVGANIQEFISSLSMKKKTILKNHLKFNSQDTCNLIQEYKEIYRWI